MEDRKFITVYSNKSDVKISINSILYVKISRNVAEIHVFGGKIYKTRTTLGEIEQSLGDEFVKIHRSCLVSVMAIYNVTDKVYLINGESLDFVYRKKDEIISRILAEQKYIINSMGDENAPKTDREYSAYYRSFDDMPFAFADIEMIFDDERRAVDWIFRYGNEALAKLEKIPLEKLIGSCFGKLFENMDAKWLTSYERAAIYGENLEIIDYSPEIDTYLHVICFPTFKGHCGCILFDISQVKFAKESNDSERALMMYVGKMIDENRNA